MFQKVETIIIKDHMIILLLLYAPQKIPTQSTMDVLRLQKHHVFLYF